MTDEVVAEFLIESYDNLDQLDRDLLLLEEEPDSTATLASVFRTVHTIKGTCGFLGFTTLEAVSHVGESLLSRLRDGALGMTPEMATALLALSDAIREILGHIEAQGDDVGLDYTELVATLTRLRDGVPEPRQDAPVSRLGDLLIEAGATTQVDVAEAIARQKQGDTRPLGQILVAQGSVTEGQVDAALATQAAQRASSVADSSVRVSVALLDHLTSLIGELIVARDQLVHLTADGDDDEVRAVARRLDVITTELRQATMRTRLQPVGNVWRTLPRVVRDLAVSSGKRVRIEMDGEAVELDKAIIEAIKDPLVHLVRNAVDHGVEGPDARTSAGKPKEGRLSVSAWHDGDHVTIEIADDGGGIAPDVLPLIFTPGFSTAREVTTVSGRGVGMDVVRTNVERVGGTITVHSVVGSGTTFTITIPITQAMGRASGVRSASCTGA